MTRADPDRARTRRSVGMLLALPMTWLTLIYLVPIALLFITAFWTTDGFTGRTIKGFSLENLQAVVDPANPFLLVAARTLGVAVTVTVLSVMLALPTALFMARVASPRWQPLLLAAVLTPLWASYLVKVYSWRVLLSPEGGFLSSGLGASPGYGWVAIVLVLTYLWFPYMVLPVYVGMQQIPGSHLEASADLGAHTWRTIRTIVIPAVKPALAAGSVFTFSLSLGDYITVELVGGKEQMLGNVVYDSFGTNLPFAAAVASLTVIIMIGYLLAVRRTGALSNL